MQVFILIMNPEIYEERVEDITKEGGEIKSICEYKRRF